VKGRRLLLGFFGRDVNIFNAHELGLDSTDLSKIVKRFESEALLYVRVISFHEEEGTLLVDIIRYDSESMPEFELHEQLIETIKKIKYIRFKNINTLTILKLAAGKRESKLEGAYFTSENIDLFYNEDYGEDFSESILKNEEKEEPSIKLTSPPPLPVKYFREKIKISIKKIRFVFGGAAFDYKFTPQNRNIEVIIFNDVLREEFDAVKNYFEKLLKTKSIEISIEIEYQGDEILKIHAFSPQISKITSDAIENVRFDFVNDVKRAKFFTDVDKSFFTPEEFYNHFDELKKKGNSFFNDPNALFDEILGIESAKHYKHLRYLSSLHAHNMMKLRFVLKPLSFIFLIKGKNRFHFVWETLDSEEATWVWHSGNSREELLRTLSKIEDILNVIKIQGKIAYINSSDDMFRRVIHDYSDLREGFIKWKYELDSLLF
jgi:hypothetical protein